MHVTGTTPYPWPWDGSPAGPGTALLVLLPPPGRVLTPQVRAAVVDRARAVRRAGGPVITATTTAPPRLGGAGPAPDGDRAADLGDPADLAVPADLGGTAPDHHVVAGGLDAFYASDLDLLLRTRGVRQVLLAGHGLETAVHSTMRDANDRGYECVLVVDACLALEPDLLGPAVSMVEMSGGIFGAVGRTSAVVAWLGAGPDRTPSTLAPTTLAPSTPGDL